MPRRPTWIVTVVPGHPLPALTSALAQAGFEVGEVLDAIGVITGRGTAAVAHALRALPGVADVAADGGVDIGPPG